MISGKSIRGILHYNEHKVSDGKARMILAGSFGKDVERMSFQKKLTRFENLTMLNGWVKTNALHISLNFAPGEKLDDRTLRRIAVSYMDKIGFGEQPYLVYRHHDAAHPHLHIATIIINESGERIDIHNIGKRLSEPARKEIEKEFGLVQATGKQKKENLAIRPISIKCVQYGKIPTKQGITRIVSAVKQSYQFSSLSEFNAILRQFNVLADRGQPGTAMHERRGLQYSVLDEAGNPIGVPIKASTLSGKPTLKALERLFEKNKVKPKRLKEDLKFRVASVLNRNASLSAATFTEELLERGVNVFFRRNERGFTYGITFVDHKNRIVFNGSQLGKGFSAKAILTRFENGKELLRAGKKTGDSLRQGDREKEQPKSQVIPSGNLLPRPANFLTRTFTEDTMDPSPPVPSRKRKKKRPGMHL